jgi:hypothetical protein
MKLTLTENGCLSEMVPTGTSSPILFRADEFSGPCWTYGEKRIAMTPSGSDPLLFTGEDNDLNFDLRYTVQPDQLTLHASIRNTGPRTKTDIQAGIRLGVDTYMEKYPDWQDRLFPTHAPV